MGKKEGVDKSKAVVLLGAAFLCFFMIGNAGATDGTTFPVDEAGLAAYVKVNESIDLEKVMDLYPYVEVVNETYVIGQVYNADGQYTRLYVGADGWVIPYIQRDRHASYIVRWNRSSPYDPTPKSVAAMNTFEESISRVCGNLEVDYETIKPSIKYYDFEYPNATNIMIVLDIAEGVGSSDYFELWIPPESIAIVNESSWSHYTDFGSLLQLDGGQTNALTSSHESMNVGSSSLSPNDSHTILVRYWTTGAGDTNGVGWVLIYTKKP
jgi:hypothetical protein